MDLRRGVLPVTLCFIACLIVIGAQSPDTLAGPRAKRKRMSPGGKWLVRSMKRPRPMVVTPPTPSTQERPGKPPSDAIVLFDGTNFDEWVMVVKRKRPPKIVAPAWKIENGYMEVVPGTGDLRTKREFRDCQIHIEWATPSRVKGSGQGRGNSGVFLIGQCEVQVLDSYKNDTYPDGQAGALYGKYPPLVNACRKPGEWQTYDIVFYAPRYEGNKMVKPARLSVFHNGIVIHHAVNPGGRSRTIRLGLQDHRNPVRYRNIWVRELHGYDYVPRAGKTSEPEKKPSESPN